MIIKAILVAVDPIGFRVPKIQRLLQVRKKIRFFEFIFSHPLHTHAAHSHHAIRIHSHAGHPHAVGHHARHPGHSHHPHAIHANNAVLVIQWGQARGDLLPAERFHKVGRCET